MTDQIVRPRTFGPASQRAPFLTGEEQRARFTPHFEIKQTEDGFVFEFDIPGALARDLEITMTGNRLTIRGTREAQKEKHSDVYYARVLLETLGEREEG